MLVMGCEKIFSLRDAIIFLIVNQVSTETMSKENNIAIGMWGRV